jgi:hypothetical protein
MWQKIKGLLDQGVGEWGIVVLVFLVGLTAFGLGRLSAFEDVRPPVSITSTEMESAPPQGMYAGGLVVASRSGSAYYYPWCGGADKILSKNQIWFQSEESAVRAGYRAAKNCKGLGSE